MSKVEQFLNDIEAVCKKHELSIAHEDIGGAFIIAEYSDTNMRWLREALVDNPEWTKANNEVA